MSLDEIDYIFGVDQTGAIKSKVKKTAKPLPLSILKKNCSNKWETFNFKNKQPLFLKSFNFDEIDKTLKEFFNDNLKNIRILIVVDTVIGLPCCVSLKDLSPLENIQKLLVDIKLDKKGFGAKIAEEFFNSFLAKRKHTDAVMPKRVIERLLNANSLFNARPYQKNIQTGSYRVLKDLSEESFSNYILYPFQKPKFRKGKPVILEGYPSLAWRLLNESLRTADSFNVLSNKLNNKIINLKDFKKLSKDHKDAALLTYLAYYLMSNDLFLNNKKVSVEGDILGSHLVKS